MNNKARRIIELLDLKPLLPEGGYFRETYRCGEKMLRENLPQRYISDRSYCTAIYYLLTPESFSSLHKVLSDEIFHFYLGDPVEMLQLFEDGTGTLLSIGNDLEMGEQPQVIVPRNIWQGARLRDGGEFALFGTTVAPGFDYEDFITPDPVDILQKYPQFRTTIEKLLPEKS